MIMCNVRHEQRYAKFSIIKFFKYDRKNHMLFLLYGSKYWIINKTTYNQQRWVLAGLMIHKEGTYKNKYLNWINENKAQVAFNKYGPSRRISTGRSKKSRPDNVKSEQHIV